MEVGKSLEIGSTSTGAKAFPDDFRVLVVDDDPIFLKIIETMLRTSKYKVVAANQGMDALNLLRERNGQFDIVLTDVHMPRMDGFELLDHIKREFKIPVILMSTDDKPEVVAKGLQSGACFFLLKPIRMKDLQNLWQHVLRRRCVTHDTTHHSGSIQEVLPPDQNVMGEDVQCASVHEDNWTQQDGMRKMPKETNEEEEESKIDSTSPKRTRMVWDFYLHKKFLEAIAQIGFDNVAPKKILQLMKVPGVTREQVASHLQKYRICIKRSQEASQIMEATPPSCFSNEPLNSSFPVGYPSTMLYLEQGYPQFFDRRQMPYQQGIRSNIQILNEPLNSSFPVGHPSTMFNLEQGYPQFFDQRHLSQMPYQQGIRSNIQGLRAASNGFSLGTKTYGIRMGMGNQGNHQQPGLSNSPFFNRQNFNSSYPNPGMEPHGTGMGAPSHKQSFFYMGNQGNLQQRWPGNSSSLNEYVSRYPTPGMEPNYGIRMGTPLHGDISSGYVRSTANTMPMVHQQTQLRPGFLGNGHPLNHNFTTSQSQDNFSVEGNMGVGNMGSFGDFNQAQAFDVREQESLTPLPLPPPLPAAVDQHQNGGEAVDSFFDLPNVIFSQDDWDTVLQQGGEEVLEDPNFDISEFLLDDNNPAL